MMITPVCLLLTLTVAVAAGLPQPTPPPKLTSEPLPPTSKVKLASSFTNCIEVDLYEIEKLRTELEHFIDFSSFTNIENESYGLSKDDWKRLELLEDRLPDDSPLKRKLVHAFRILISALYQAHKPSVQGSPRTLNNPLNPEIYKNPIVSGVKSSNGIDEEDNEVAESERKDSVIPVNTSSPENTNDEYDTETTEYSPNTFENTETDSKTNYENKPVNLEDREDSNVQSIEDFNGTTEPVKKINNFYGFDVVNNGEITTATTINEESSITFKTESRLEGIYTTETYTTNTLHTPTYISLETPQTVQSSSQHLTSPDTDSSYNIKPGMNTDTSSPANVLISATTEEDSRQDKSLHSTTFSPFQSPRVIDLSSSKPITNFRSFTLVLPEQPKLYSLKTNLNELKIIPSKETQRLGTPFERPVRPPLEQTWCQNKNTCVKVPNIEFYNPKLQGLYASPNAYSSSEDYQLGKDFKRKILESDYDQWWRKMRKLRKNMSRDKHLVL